MMQRTTLVFFLAISFFIAGCASSGREVFVRSQAEYPERTREAIVAKWGYPAEILQRPWDEKLGKHITTWVYYLKDDDGSVFPIFYNFRGEEPLASNSFIEPRSRFVVLDMRKIDDLKLVLSERERMRKIWPALAK